jgi:hypothetical protein
MRDRAKRRETISVIILRGSLILVCCAMQRCNERLFVNKCNVLPGYLVYYMVRRTW